MDILCSCGKSWRCNLQAFVNRFNHFGHFLFSRELLVVYRGYGLEFVEMTMFYK